MLVAFAKNMTLVDYNLVMASTYTDPVAIGANSYATGITNVHKILNPGAGGLNWTMEVSVDGQTFTPMGPSSGALSTEAITSQAATRISGAYARLHIQFQAAATDIGAATFDIQVSFDVQ